MSKDYYKILGVDKNASKEDIKKAYKRLAKKHHPDMNGGSESSEKFKEVNEAASVLGDDNKRAQYDQFGDADAFQKAGYGGGFEGFDSDMFHGSFDFGSIFDQLFGGGGMGGRRARRGPVRGRDLIYELEIELEDSAFGSSKNITVPRFEKCETCGGSGAESKDDIVTCPTCNGSGHEKKTRRTPFGMFVTTTTCSKCRGKGEHIEKECKKCDGTGLIKKTRKIEVEIPKGVEHGMKLRISGQGEAPERGGESGDLYVVIFIKPHKIFTRDGDDLDIEVPISFTLAALGGSTEVPTLKGKAKLKIPSGTQTDTVFRMKNKGMPNINGYGSGDENVKVIVQIPEKLNKKQKQLLEEFDKTGSKKKGFFGVF